MLIAISTVLQLRDKLVEFYTRIPLLTSFSVDNSYFHSHILFLTTKLVQAESNKACFNCRVAAESHSL